MTHNFKPGDKVHLRKDRLSHDYSCGVDWSLEAVDGAYDTVCEVLKNMDPMAQNKLYLRGPSHEYYVSPDDFEPVNDEAPAESNWTVNNEWPWYPDAHIMD